VDVLAHHTGLARTVTPAALATMAARAVNFVPRAFRLVHHLVRHQPPADAIVPLAGRAPCAINVLRVISEVPVAPCALPVRRQERFSVRRAPRADAVATASGPVRPAISV
jgi:hypothetical protein